MTTTPDIPAEAVWHEVGIAAEYIAIYLSDIGHREYHKEMLAVIEALKRIAQGDSNPNHDSLVRSFGWVAAHLASVGHGPMALKAKACQRVVQVLKVGISDGKVSERTLDDLKAL